jgi:hypothetical protein
MKAGFPLGAEGARRPSGARPASRWPLLCAATLSSDIIFLTRLSVAFLARFTLSIFSLGGWRACLMRGGSPRHGDGRALLREIGRQVALPARPRSVPRSIDNCIFCGGQPTNNEHIWPRWLRPYLPKPKRKTHVSHATLHPDRSDVEFVSRGGDPHDWQVKCVDERCNNGWMRTVEDRAKKIFIRLIGDHQTRITESDQLTLATWIAIKAIVADFAFSGHVISHHMQRRRLWKSRRPPDRKWRMWIGYYDGPGSRLYGYPIAA